VSPVCFQVGKVVDDVDDTGQQAEQDKTRHRSHQGFRLEKLPVKDQRRKQESVFRPLLGSHGCDQGFKSLERHAFIIA
jgi:hypothetical protein